MSTTSTIARAVVISRQDGERVCLTDHDEAFTLDEHSFRPSAVMEMRAVETKLGLSTDNTEIASLISAECLSREDIERGRYDSAHVECFEYDWQAGKRGATLFDGQIDRITYDESTLDLDLRWGFDRINHQFGRGFHRSCHARLGDENCGVDLNLASYSFESEIIEVVGHELHIDNASEIANGHLARGMMIDIATGVRHLIARDRIEGARRVIALWDEALAFEAGAARYRFTIGCDQSLECCAERFGNAACFQGFPFIPNESWLKVKADNA